MDVWAVAVAFLCYCKALAFTLRYIENSNNFFFHFVFPSLLRLYFFFIFHSVRAYHRDVCIMNKKKNKLKTNKEREKEKQKERERER